MNFITQKEVDIPIGKLTVQGSLVLPKENNGIVIFSHGSGSSRYSRRNQMVAKKLNDNNFGTLLFDLLTEEEDQIYENRFDIDLLSKRLIMVTEWVRKQANTNHTQIAYFGASTGAASALMAAAKLKNISAVVSRGGRPDLAMKSLPNVVSPTLLIVGSLDQDVLALNKIAFDELKCEKNIEIIEGASHLFEEPGKMDLVCTIATNWFEKFMEPIKI